MPIDFSEIVVLFFIAAVLIKPEDLPGMMHAFGKALGYLEEQWRAIKKWIHLS